MTNIVLLTTGIYLVVSATVLHTKNFTSLLIFKAIPAVFGVLCLLCFVLEMAVKRG